MEVHGDDYPIPGAEKVAGIILPSGMTNVSYIRELQQVTIEAQDSIGEIRQGSDSNLEILTNDSEDELKSPS